MIKILQIIFSDDYGTELEINKRKIFEILSNI